MSAQKSFFKNLSLLILLCLCVFFYAPNVAAQQQNLAAQEPAATGGFDIDEEKNPALPEIFSGAWEKGDRIIFFDSDDENTRVDFSVILKTYYGWFYDRVAEPVSYSEREKRFRCTATAKAPERFSVLFEPIPAWQDAMSQRNISDSNGSAYEIVLRHANKEVTRVPVAVIDDALYLDFAIKSSVDSDYNEIRNLSPQGTAVSEINLSAENADTEAETEKENVSENGEKILGFWQGVSQKRGLLAAPLDASENITCYYFTENEIYSIRYWKNDATVDAAVIGHTAYFTDGEENFFVPKRIFSVGEAYICAAGRRSLIRNIEKSNYLAKKITYDSSGTIFALGEPYLKKASAIENVDMLMQVVAEANSRRKPDPEPLFPPNDVNWYWDDIYRLESGNMIIKKIRERQGR